MGRYIKRILLCGAVCAGWTSTEAQTVPQMSTATAADLAPHVLIRRDTFGVPHITADSDEAAAFGLGYAQAEDHAVEMGKLYLTARGEGARWFGPEETEHDLVMKRMGNLEGARRALAESGDGYRHWLHGFVTGVNAYVAQHFAEMPAWYPLVTEADIIAFSHEGSASSAGRPRAGGGEGEDYFGAEQNVPLNVDVPGSNALAIAGSHTTTGAPILLANPHLRWTAQYWEAQITVPGRINFYGSLTVGLPVLRAGFSDTIGYAQTNNNVDLVDHYAVPIDAANADHYVFKGVSKPFRHQKVRVEVLQPDGHIGTEEREYLATDFGPVVSRDAKAAVVTRLNEAWRFHEGYYDLYFAKNLDQFMGVLGKQLIPSSNFTYADADGNIQYLWNSALPKRPAGDVNYGGVVPGADDRYFFNGIVPMSEVPRFLNPASGYVMNSNNPPWFATVRERLDPSKFPPYMEQGEPGLRPQMALRLLESRKMYSAADVLKLKFTDHMLLADRVLPDLLAAGGKAKNASADLKLGLRILKGWDQEVSAKSKGAVLFVTFWDIYREGRRQLFREPWSNDKVIDTPTGLADPAAALVALEKAVAQTRTDYGAADIAWGEVNRYRFGDIDLPGDGAAGGIGGCSSCYGLYRVQRFDETDAKRNIAGRPGYDAPIAGFGDGWILMTSFTKPVSAQGILAYGQSSNADSPHARDQIKLFASHQLRPIWFTDAEVKAHTEREYHPGDAAGDLTRKDGYVNSDAGVRVFVREVTAKDTRGEPILLVHDAGAGGMVSFDLPNASLAADLARAGHPVTVMDVRGWEKSSRPAALDQSAAQNAPATSLDEAARDIDAVVSDIQRRRGTKVAVLGWGAGATWAGNYAVRHPESLAHLVLLNPAGAHSVADCTVAAGAYQLADAHALRKRWDAALPAKNMDAWRDDMVAEAYVQRALRLDPTSVARAPASIRIPNGATAEACSGQMLWDATRVTTPTLVVRGEKDDTSAPDDMAALQKTMTAPAKFVTIKGGTHYLHLDRPEHGRKQLEDETLAFLKGGP